MKKTTIRIETAPRELSVTKKVCDIVADYVGLDTEIKFTLIHLDSPENKKEFTLKEFESEEDNLTRKEFISEVEEVKIIDYLLNTGITESYTNKNGEEKERTQILNTKSLVEIYIK